MEHRRFLVSACLTLVFATAIGFAWRRALYHDQRVGYPYASLRGAADTALSVWWLICPWVSMLSLALLAMRLRCPRPKWRRLARQPGFVACLFAGTAAVLS